MKIPEIIEAYSKEGVGADIVPQGARLKVSHKISVIKPIGRRVLKWEEGVPTLKLAGNQMVRRSNDIKKIGNVRIHGRLRKNDGRLMVFRNQKWYAKF